MIKRQTWFERDFPSGLPTHLLPVVVERLRGTPARLTDLLSEIPFDQLTRRTNGKWSIQEHVGHLLDLEPLGLNRLADLEAQRPELTAADLKNRRTQDADHNSAKLENLLQQFRRARREFVARLEQVSHDVATYRALHPRLQQPMNVVDLAYFIAEHDDYHLARISELLRGS